MNDPDSIRCWREADDGIHTRLYYNITSAEWNCTEHYGKCDSCPKSQSDPDIAGIGVSVLSRHYQLGGFRTAIFQEDD